MDRVARLARHVAPPLLLAPGAATESPIPLPSPENAPVEPTMDAAQALRDFEVEGYCVLKSILNADEVAMYRDHLLGVMGDNRYLDKDGHRIDVATRRFTEPTVSPPREERSYTITAEGDRFSHANAGEGQHWHNGDFGGRYGGEFWKVGFGAARSSCAAQPQQTRKDA